jgi:hypothetical protein
VIRALGLFVVVVVDVVVDVDVQVDVEVDVQRGFSRFEQEQSRAKTQRRKEVSRIIGFENRLDAVCSRQSSYTRTRTPLAAPHA